MPVAPRATFDNPYGPQVSFRTEDILPPPSYYVSPDDRVALWGVSDLAGTTVVFTFRLLTPQGEVKLMPYTLTVPAAYQWMSLVAVPPVEGYILGAVCWGNNPARGRLFVAVVIVRGDASSQASAGEVLLQGYPNSLSNVSYPTSPIEPTFSGRGAFLTITNPTVTGVDLKLSVPQNTLWRFCSLSFFLETSAAPGNRHVNFASWDAVSNLVGLWPSNFLQPPSTTFRYGFSPGGANVNQGTVVSVAGPSDLFLPPQGSLRTGVESLDAGDQIVGTAMLVEEWMGI